MALPKSRNYQAYLLRCWQESGASWRFSLEDSRTGQRHGFASLEALVLALQSKLAGNPAADQPPPEPNEAE